ncbi:DUF2339 domain-containing protein [Lentisphaerota bacterium WC36G]|nr:DUF2339 domain-containing protein [Lentisphaerae bacterium WC36]
MELIVLLSIGLVICVVVIPIVTLIRISTIASNCRIIEHKQKLMEEKIHEVLRKIRSLDSSVGHAKGAVKKKVEQKNIFEDLASISKSNVQKESILKSVEVENEASSQVDKKTKKIVTTESTIDRTLEKIAKDKQSVIAKKEEKETHFSTPLVACKTSSENMKKEVYNKVESQTSEVEKTTVQTQDSKEEYAPSAFELKAQEILRNIWDWIIVGDNFRRKDIAKEYAIATTWFVRFAIIMLLSGCGYFLKFSIEKNYLTPTARVILILISGLAMVVGGLKITGPSKKYDLIGRGVIGGGIGLLYFSAFSAFHLYHLISQFQAFGLMILVTITASVIAIKKRLLLVAVIGILGGYLTPVVLSSGIKHLYELFTYLSILGAGTLFISKYRGWKLLNIISFIATYALFLGALGRFYDLKVTADYTAVVLFSSIYFVLFSFMSVIHNIYKKKIVTMIELVALLTNTVIFIATNWYYTCEKFNRHYVAIFTFAAAIFFIINILYILRKKYQDRNLVVILSSLSILAIILTVPLALSKIWITATWGLIAVFFLYNSLKLKSKMLFLGSLLTYALAIFRVFAFDQAFKLTLFRSAEIYRPLFEKQFTDSIISAGVVAFAVICGGLLVKKYRESMQQIAFNFNWLVKSNVFYNIFLYSGVAMLFSYSYVQVLNIGYIFVPEWSQPLQFVLLFALAVFFFVRLKIQKHFVLENALMCLVAVMIIKLLYLLHYDGFSTKNWAFGNIFSWLELGVRTAIYVTFFAVLYFYKCILRSIESLQKIATINVIEIVSLFLILSFELSSALYFFLPQFRTGGVSVYWAIYALTMTFFGLKNDIKYLRYASLALLAVDIIKIFFVDLKHLDTIPKVIALIITSLLLMAGAFIYIKAQTIFVAKREEIK